MMPLYDMMMSAQNGEAMRAMARQFGLDDAQMEKALAALMPAFSTGLKRNTSNPADLASFLAALAGGGHQRYFDDLTNAFAPQGVNEGNGILGHLFGSKEVSRALADQAAAATGIGQEVFKQMLPVLATSIMGGLFKQSMGHAASASGGSTGNPFADMIGEMMRGGMGSSDAREPDRSAGASGNPMGQFLEGMLSGGRKQEARPEQTADPMDNPLGRLFKDMINAGLNRPDARQDRPENSKNPYDELFGKMFDSGREVQKGYQKSVESIFDQYLEGMNRLR